MTFVVAAKWVAKEGKQEIVADAISQLAVHSKNEVGNIEYVVHRSIEDERTFFFYEVYENEDGYKHHTSSKHFVDIAINGVIPLLDSRDREFFKVWNI